MTRLSDLRDSVNETARVARNNLLVFLVVGLYVGLLIARTDDLLLLKNARIDLPLMQIGVPVDLFYAIAPILFVLLHVNLMLRLSRLARVAGLLRIEIAGLRGHGNRSVEAALVFPFDFLQLLLYRNAFGTGRRPPPKRQFLRFWRYESEAYGNIVPLVAIVAIPVFVLPLALLIWMQVRFLPYQSQGITLLHQAVVTADIALQFIFISHLGMVRKLRFAIRRGSRMEQSAWIANATMMLIYVIAPLLFVWWVAVVLGSWVERNRLWPQTASSVTATIFGDWWTTGDCRVRRIRHVPHFRRFLYVPGKSIGARDRPYEIIAAYVERSEDPDKAWNFVDELDLSGRSLQYGWFVSAEFWRTNLSDTDLRCARFDGGKLRDAVLDGAELHRTDFRGADLTGASLSGVEADGARFRESDLRRARMHGARFLGGDFRRAKLHGARVEGAHFLGTDLSLAEFHGAHLRSVDYVGANLARSLLHGADLQNARFHATHLDETEFHGADLTDAEFHGGSLVAGKFCGASLLHAEMLGVDARNMRIHGADVRSLDVALTDLRGMKWDKPCSWSAVEGAINRFSRLEGTASDDRRRRLKKIQSNMKRPYHSRGLDALDRADCVWTDRMGPFRGWSVPGRSCLDRFADAQLGMACGKNARFAATRVVNMQLPMESWVGVHVALALVETSPQQCPAITSEYRDELCGELDTWFRELPEPEVPGGSVLTWSQRKGIVEHWSKVKQAGLC